MKPNFALTLSFEGIGLLHRAFPGWHMVGEVSLDSPDLSGDLDALRAKADRLDNHPIRSKLVIPNDQIRFLQFDSEGLGADEIADAVHHALDGTTPYAVEDLAYDWSISAGQVHVAAVARETLAEAESFATEHGFNPLCFVAIPEGRDFVGEPWFGNTTSAAELLPEGDHVERDTAAIRVIGVAPVPSEPREAPAAPASDPEVETTVAPTPAEPQARNPEPPETLVVSEPEKAAPDDTPTDQAAPPEPDTTEEAAPVAFSSIRARRDTLPSAAPRLSGATRDAATPAPEPDLSSAKDTRSEPPLTAAPPPAEEVIEQVTGTPKDALADDAAARIGATLRPTETDRMAAALDQSEDAPDDIPPPPPFMVKEAEPPLEDLPVEADDIPPIPAALDQTADETHRTPSFFTRRRLKGRRLSLRPSTRGTPSADREHEKQRMTVFGARKAAPAVGGKPRYLGAILTVVLLIFLVGVAAWATFFLDDGLSRVLRETPDPQIENVAATPSIDEIERIESTDNTPDPAAEQDAETVVASLPGVTSDVEETPRVTRPEPDPSVLSEQDARTRYAVTGIWQRAPEPPNTPDTQSLDDFYLTSIDPKVLEQDAIALPEASALLGDARPDTPAAPPAAGTIFRLDPRGFVRATPEGALTPEGVRVFAGKPAILPPERPGQTRAEPVIEGETTTDTVTETESLPVIRPRSRPEDLTERNERETLGGRTRQELATIRPRLRPQSAQELAEQAAAASTAEVTPDPDAVDAAVQEAAALQTADPFAGATAQAVSVSVKPNPRPRNFDRIVRRSQRQAEQEEVQTAAVAVPRAQRVTPSGPTPTTVARAATEKNALKLKRVNLIGVYGTASNRRALVRLANGRYKKVKVGDRLDGGRVAAIGTSELRYVKSGRSVTLKMPRG